MATKSKKPSKRPEFAGPGGPQGGPGESGPGEPGYDGKVNLGEDGVVTETTREMDLDIKKVRRPKKTRLP
jgi:hypothetical protein